MTHMSKNENWLTVARNSEEDLEGKKRKRKKVN